MATNTQAYAPPHVSLAKKILSFILMLSMSVSTFVGSLMATPQTALAAGGITITNHATSSSDSRGMGGFSNFGWFSARGENAFCGNYQKDFPMGSSLYYSNVSNATGAYNAVIYYGQVEYKKTGQILGTSLSAGEAQAATQFGIWMVENFYNPGAGWTLDGSFSNPHMGGARQNAYTWWGNNAKTKRVINAAAALAQYARDHQDVPTVAWQATGSPNDSLYQKMYGVIPTVTVNFKKNSNKPEYTNNNNSYSLEGATYEIYDSSNRLIDTLVFDAQGNTKSLQLAPNASYYAKETKAPLGYALHEQPINFSTSSSESTVTFTDEAQNDPARFVVHKVDAETGKPVPQGDASLADAEFTVKYYAGQYTTVDELPAEATRTWVFKTGSDGKAVLDDTFKVAGDELYIERGVPTLPLGTVTIQETKAPVGYKLGDQPVHLRNITSDGWTVSVNTYVEPEQPETVKSGRLVIHKVDAETGKPSPLGGATFAGAKFEVINASQNAVKVGDSEFAPNDSIITLTTDTDGLASLELPYGTYRIREISAPLGYLLAEPVEQTVTIHNDADEVLDFDMNAVEQVKRGDFRFNKVDEKSMESLANVPFKLTSTTTGESHIIVTDENGMLDTSASWNAHSTKTNANDDALLEDGTIDEDALDATAGVWFSGKDPFEEGGKVQDSLGALPYDTYLLEELPVSANEGHALITKTIKISRHKVNLDFGTVDDHTNPPHEIIGLHTTLTGEDGTKEFYADEDITLVDTVSYTGLEKGKTYTLDGVLMDKETGLAVTDESGKPLTASTTFIPDETEGTAQVTFNFNAEKLGGKTLVAFETLSHEDEIVAEHKDIDDVDQTVTIKPYEIHTTLTDDAGNKTVKPEKVKLIDSVEYKNLVIGKEYTMVGTLMVKETGKALLDENGNPVTASKTFVAESSDGTVEIEFELDASKLAGKHLVAFEKLERDGIELVAHENLEDVDQTIEVKDDTEYPPNMGDPTTVSVAGAALASSAVALGAGMYLKRRKKLD